MEQLSEELVLLSPLQLHGLPAEGTSLFRFSLSAANTPPIELAADSEEDRQRWMFALGESMCAGGCTGSPAGSPVSVTQAFPGEMTSALGSPLGGRVQLGRSKVADNYTTGKVLAQGDDYMIVEGFNLKTHRSHALKLLAKSSKRLMRRGWFQGGSEAGSSLGPRVCSRLLSQCLEEVYEGQNHVCMVMHWGSHELDADHELACAVLEALRLLHELLPHDTPEEGLMLRAQDTQRLMMRLLALDCHLQANLFI